MRRSFQRCIYALHRCRLLHERRQIHHADVRRRHAHRVPIHFPLQLRNHQMQSLRCPRGTGNHVQSRSSRPPQILVRQIQQLLVIRVRVNRRHGSRLNAKRVVQHLRHGRQTIRSTRSIGNHIVMCWIVRLIVHAQHKRRVRPIRRRRNNHFLHRSAQMLLRVRALGE